MDTIRKYSSRFYHVGKFIQRNSRYFPQFLALTMIAYGLVALYGNLSLYLEWQGNISINDTIIVSISNILVLLGGIVILCRRKITILKAAATYLISVGVGKVLYYMPNLMSDSIYLYLFGIVMLILSINLIARGVSFYRGDPRNIITTTVCILAFVLLYSVLFALTLYYSEGPLLDMALSQTELILSIFLYLVFLGILDTSEIRTRSGSERIDEGINSVRRGYCASENTCISDTEAETIRNGFSDMGGWSVIDDQSPVSHEYTFIISGEFSNSEVTVQRWKGSEELYFTIADSFRGSVLFARRFSANRCTVVTDPSDEDNSWLYLYDRKGSFLRFRIVPNPIPQGSEEAI